mgnify:CR=1 FL=1
MADTNEVLGTTTGAATSALTIAGENAALYDSSAFNKAVASWLDIGIQYPIVAWSSMLGIGLLSGSKKLGSNIVSAATTWVGSWITSTLNSNEVTSAAASTMNTIYKTLADPNVGGIPISSDSVVTDRTVEVSQSLLLSQSSATKSYHIDNATPRLKDWEVSGYLTPIFNLDNFMFIKPSLILQMQFLDAVAVSRRPVWFKDNNMLFHQVQITSLHMEQNPTATNAVKITIGLKEYKPYTINNDISDMISFTKTGATS